MRNYSWCSNEQRDWNRIRMFYNDNEGIDKSCYFSIFGNLIKKMNNLGFEVKPFELIPGIRNLKIDLNENLKNENRERWLNLNEKLRGTGFSIERSGINLEIIKHYGESIFLDLTPKFIEAVEKLEFKPLIADVSFTHGEDIFEDYWFDYTLKK